MNPVKVIGAGLAGSEAAWQLAKRGIPVQLYEMRPHKYPPAFHTGQFAELVCSNSLRSDSLSNAAGLMKEEMRRLDSLVMQAADACAVPAGSALAVDREAFSAYITKVLEEHPLIEIVREEISELPEDPAIIAAGPLCSDALFDSISAFTGSKAMHFYDAAAPIVEKDSIDFSKAYFKSRYDKGDADYINCAMSEEEYNAFYNELIHAKCAKLHDFEEDLTVFEGCMPVEEMARRGQQTLLFGPLKPVGLEREGERPYAVVQLRQDNAAKSLYNIVGFQTHLTWPEQKRVFSMIPGLENAVFTRYGVMHRNSFLCSPGILNETYQSVKNENLYFAGQITGVEGYIESAASGLLAGISLARQLQNKERLPLSRKSAIGAQAWYISHAAPKDFQPMNANFGIMEEIRMRGGRKAKREAQSKRALEYIDEIKEELNA